MRTSDAIQMNRSMRATLTTFTVAFVSALLLNTSALGEWVSQMAPSDSKTVLHQTIQPVHKLSDQLTLTSPRALVRSEFKSLQKHVLSKLTCVDPEAGLKDVCRIVSISSSCEAKS